MQDTAEPSIGALSVFHDLCTKRGFFLFQGLGPAGRNEKTPMHLNKKRTSSEVSTPDPRLKPIPMG